jgi:ankyrin repeat protein
MKHLLLTTIAVVVLVGCGESPKDIWEAAEQGDIEAVKEYLAIGTNVNAKDEAYGGMPLHWAAYSGRNEVAEFLINEGADVNAKNQADATPLDKAIEKNRDETVSLLRKHGGKTGEELKTEPK